MDDGIDPTQLTDKDIVVTPMHNGFLIGQIRGSAWTSLAEEPTWQLALRKAGLLRTFLRARVIASRTGTDLRVFDPDDAWLDTTREWWPFVAAAIERQAPAQPGVYVVRGTTPMCIGDTENLRDRLLYHLREAWATGTVEDALEYSFEAIDAVDARTAKSRILIGWWLPPIAATT